MSQDDDYWNRPQPYMTGAQDSAPQQLADATAQSAQVPPAVQAAPTYGYAPPQVVVTEPKKSHGWIVAIVIVACLFLLFAHAISSCSNAFLSLASMSTVSHSSLDNLTRDTVVVIDIDGTIQYDGTACSPEGLKYLLDQAESNPHVKAIVLRVNSGGGTATAGEEMAEYVRECSLPVVVSSASINASAAYEISSQADYIFVAKSTEIGAIGTVMTITDLSGLFEKLGINMDTIASADEKDSSYGYRPLTDEEREYYQDMVNEINEVFIENVAEGRGMTIEEVRALANGMPFTGVTAVKNGIADEIGTREDAIEKAAELAGITDYDVTSLSLDSHDLSALYYLLGSDSDSLERLLELADGQKAGATVR